jgi:hypothetical protein
VAGRTATGGQAAPSARAPLPPRWPPAAASCTHRTTRAQDHCVIHRCTLSTAQQRIAPRVTSGVSYYLDGLIWTLSGRNSAQPSTSELAHTSVFFGPGWPATYPQHVFCSWRARPPRTRASTAPHHPLLCSGLHEERPASHSACARHRATARHMRPRWRGTTVRALPRQGSSTLRHDGPLLGVVSAFGGSGAAGHRLASSAWRTSLPRPGLHSSSRSVRRTGWKSHCCRPILTPTHDEHLEQFQRKLPA